jgi:uncharacterized protein (TIGR04255 family)
MGTLEKLDAPPIWEVVCGVLFEPIPELDPFMVGLYWKSVQGRFPVREVKPAVGEQTLVAGLPKLRGLFVSSDQAFVHQVQQDRFYVNWRKTNPRAVYPRFSEHDDKPGLSGEVEQRFDEFAEFVQRDIGRTLQLGRVELAKIDLLHRGVHWADIQDLAKMIPAISPLLAGQRGGRPVIALRFEDSRDDGVVTTMLESLEPTQPGEPVVKLETRVVLSVAGRAQLRERFQTANDTANDVFARLIPKEQRQQRFSTASK